MTLTYVPPRVANRVRTDEIVDALVWVKEEIPCGKRGWTRVSDVAAILDPVTAKQLSSALTYLDHCYGAVDAVGVTGDFVRVNLRGVRRYLAGERTVCPCVKCSGEQERARQ